MKAAGQRRCGRCGQVFVEIALGTQGGQVLLQSCSTCDHRTWYRQGEPVSFRGVLGELRPTDLAGASTA